MKSVDQITQAHRRCIPRIRSPFAYGDEDLTAHERPYAGWDDAPACAARTVAAAEHVRRSGSRPDAAPIVWQGSWRTLEPVWQFAPHWENFGEVWDLIDYPRLLFNTIVIAVISTIGTLISCTLVAYGFARFRFPGRGLLFTLLIATIFLPAAVTIIPTYTVFQKIGWVGTWLPLLVPAFFANAYDVFLMRQYFMTIPTEMDEAAAIDGASPFRTLISVVLPQAWPVVVAVAVFHLVYSWNDFFGPLLYTAGRSGAPDGRAGPAAVQRHLLPRARADPGGHADDARHPGRSRSC